MMNILYLIGLCLIFLAIIFSIATHTTRDLSNPSLPPPLPPRNISAANSVVRQEVHQDNRRLSSTRNSPLPARTSVLTEFDSINPTQNIANLGPRGVHPNQFPCCPIDKQRNEPGCNQKIFWIPKENCYCCSNGHKFGSNGKLICS